MSLEALPFVRVDGRGQTISNWAVESTGNYVADCEIGRQYFHSLLLVMHTTKNPTLLGRVVHDQVKAGVENWGGIEIAFHQCMAEELISES